MTLSEILKAKGIADDVAQSVLDDMKANKIFTASEENLDIRYGKLKTDHDSLTTQYQEATSLIEQLKKGTKGQEDLQGKITTYEGKIAELEKQLQQERLDNAVKLGLLSENAQDVDYLAYKLREKGELELDDSGNIKGWDDKVAGLKTQFPQQFAGNGKNGKGAYDGYKPIDDDTRHPNDGLTKESILKMPYAQRAQLMQDNPEGYNAAMHG